MVSEEKRAEYVRRAEEARAAAQACENDQLKLVLYQMARLWDRLSGAVKATIAAGIPAAAACCLRLAQCCTQVHMHCPHCWFRL